MAKDKLTDYSATNASNTDIGGINIDEGMLPSAVNNALREQMTHLKNFSDGTDAITGLTVNGNIKLDGNYPTGSNNVALGSGALDDGSLSGSGSVAIGSNALTACTSGGESVAVGFGALDAMTTAFNNVGIGRNALGSTTTGGTNVAVGDGSLALNVSGTANVGIGADALSSNTASNNTAVGRSALQLNTSGAGNTAVGSFASDANTTGANTAAFGAAALSQNTTADAGTAIGSNALTANTTGANNTGVGFLALGANTTGQYNTAVGANALDAVTTSSFNTGIGYSAGGAVTTGAGNTMLGYETGMAITTQDGNTFLGQAAGNDATSANNTMVGYLSGQYITSGAKNTILGAYDGNQGGLDIRTSNNHIVLSDGDGNPRQIINGSGDVLINTTSLLSDGKLSIAAPLNARCASTMKNTATQAGGQTYIRFLNNADAIAGSIQHTGTTTTSYGTSSDYRLKENVVDMTGATTRLKQLNPVRFNFIADADKTVDGFLAHEVQTVVPEAVMGEHNGVDDSGNPVMQQIDHSKLVPLLVATIQELEARIATLEAK